MQLKRNKEMEFETLKKNHKKQLIIGALTICVIGGALTFNLTRAKYKVTESIPLVRGNVNYSVPDLRVVAIKTSEDGTNYTDVSDVPASGYTLNTTNSVCKLATTDAKDNNITIEYKDGKVNFLGVGNKNTRCYLYFDKYIYPMTITDIMTVNNPKTTTPDFSKVATIDEGVYAAEDGMYGGTSYYWRGAVTNNYVKFAGFCWRAIRINGDNTIRLIYDGSTCHMNGTSNEDSIVKISQTYNSSRDRSEYVGWSYSIGIQRTTNGTSSNAKTQTESWFNSNIGNNTIYANKVAEGKFCNDRNTASGYSWSSQPSSSFNYAAEERLQSDYVPALSCPSEDIYTLKAGIITSDEVSFAGGVYAEHNNSYYLYNNKHYWTMTPHHMYYGNYSYQAYVFYVGTDGYLQNVNVDWIAPGIRPVINLKANTTFSSGDGTLNNPYIVE